MKEHEEKGVKRIKWRNKKKMKEQERKRVKRKKKQRKGKKWSPDDGNMPMDLVRQSEH